MNTLEILTKAKALINTPDTWTQGSNARDANGHTATLLGEKACKFCMNGALERVSDFTSYSARLAVYDALGHRDIVHWNDAHNRKHEDVMAVFDKAIELFKAHPERYPEPTE